MSVSKAQRQAHGKRAAIYARVSDKSQAEDDKTSLSEQIGDMEAHCEDKGMTVTARYQEVGRGWSKKRPEFQRMLADAKRGRFDTIVCWKSDRLSRGMYPAAALMEVIEAYHINLEAVMDAIDMKTFGLMAAIGKIELDNFRERASMGKRGTAKQGRIPVSNVPYGYRIGDDGRPVIVEEEAEVVRRIYHMCVSDGMGASVIGQRLNAEAVPLAKLGKRWYDGTIHRILSNETYKGTWWYGKARYVSTEDGVRVYEQPEEDWIGVPFPPLVDEEIWERARVLRRQRFTRAKRNTKIFYLLQHLVRCAECGLLMGGQANTKKEVKRNGKLYKYELDPPRRYYRCYGYHQLRLKCREKPMIRAERLEGLVWGEVKRVLDNPDLIVAGIEALDNREGGGLAEEIATAERDLQKVQMEEERVIRLFVSGKITEDQMDHQRGYITERLETLLNLMPQSGVFWIGGDLGYTNDPTEIVVFQEVELPERRYLKLVLRVHMEHVAYPHIAQTIGLLDRYYTATGIGVDNGGNGLAVVQELLTLDKYRDLQLDGRLRGYDFGGMTTLAVRDGKEVRKRTKEFMTSLINGALQRRQVVFPVEDLEIEDQFTTHTYTLHDGRVVYAKGNDHIVDAVRCAMLAREQANLDQVGEETVSLVPVMTDPVFV